MIKLLAQTAIDAVQSAQKTAITTFVKHEGLANSLTNLVDAHAEHFTNTLNVTHEVVSNLATKASSLTPNSFHDAFNKIVTSSTTAAEKKQKGAKGE